MKGEHEWFMENLPRYGAGKSGNSVPNTTCELHARGNIMHESVFTSHVADILKKLRP
jgi:hypothetical protein